MKRIINIDWLTLYCLGGNQYDISKKVAMLGYMVKDRQISTRHFKTILDVYTHDNYPIFEIQCVPTSLKRNGGIWRDGACLVKVHNRHLYVDGSISEVYASLSRVGIEVRSISRLDIAMDFQYFDNGLSPVTFIRNFHKNKYWKIGSKKFTAIGEIDQNIEYEYLRFGSPTSNVKVYLYNKSKEMRDVRTKPYIEAVWKEAGLVKGDVWRLEVSLKSDARHMIDLSGEVKIMGKTRVNDETGEILSSDTITKTDSKGKLREIVIINIDEIAHSENVHKLYARLISHYFRFRYKESKVRKDRAKPVELFKFDKSDTLFKPVQILKAHDYNKMDKYVMNYLTELQKSDPDLLKHVFEIKKAMAEKFCFGISDHAIGE